MSENKYKIGQLAEAAGLTIRTIRYYDEMGLLKSNERTSGGQRIYSDADLVYIKRIMELKNLFFSLEEIKRIILLSDEDKSGELRREILLSSYREKLIDAEKKVKALNDHIGELKWHIKQLESAYDSFQDCPGSLCTNCSFKRNCSFSSKK
ncbi:MerR family transcriptional regulator [Spirochaetales bacterium NM-380-WT-3C1]|uniref:MerR family transcriptional regulator n=1 Tax=Bullifex porci TaxID=2606638 RepID=A0A7X2PBC5_9SPIO|nr:MerR family transcriptional regulator [Bullifex porci]MSU05744.1 MerR family transcriptional regulator [Bullifex porci]